MLLLMAGSFFLNGFAQNAPKIQRACAFYTESTPGMAMTDEKGNIINPKPIIERFIYVEYPGSKPPDIKTVLYEKTDYIPAVAKTTEIPISIGKSQEDGKEVILTPRKGYSLWKVGLHVANEKTTIPNKVKYIVIIYSVGLRSRSLPTFRLYKETQLMTPDRY